jgi:hypothetical protein
LSNIFPGTNTGYRFNEYPELYDWIIPDMKNETVQKKIEIIQKWNDYILYLKEEYKEYEDEVDNTFLKDKSFFVYQEKEHKEEDNTRKRKLEGGKRRSIKHKSNRKSNSKSKSRINSKSNSKSKSRINSKSKSKK